MPPRHRGHSLLLAAVAFLCAPRRGPTVAEGPLGKGKGQLRHTEPFASASIDVFVRKRSDCDPRFARRLKAWLLPALSRRPGAEVPVLSQASSARLALGGSHGRLRPVTDTPREVILTCKGRGNWETGEEGKS